MTRLDSGGPGVYDEDYHGHADYLRPGEEDAGTLDYVGDVVFVRDDPFADRWDGKEYLTEESETFDYVWDHGDETGEDTRDLPGAAAWGTDDSVAQDPVAATSKTVKDVWNVATGDFDTHTPDGSGDGSPDGTPWPDLPYKLIAGALVVFGALTALAPYAQLGAEVADG